MPKQGGKDIHDSRYLNKYLEKEGDFYGNSPKNCGGREDAFWEACDKRDSSSRSFVTCQTRKGA